MRPIRFKNEFVFLRRNFFCNIGFRFLQLSFRFLQSFLIRSFQSCLISKNEMFSVINKKSRKCEFSRKTDFFKFHAKEDLLLCQISIHLEKNFQLNANFICWPTDRSYFIFNTVKLCYIEKTMDERNTIVITVVRCNDELFSKMID
jgi:hypothetical protein